MSKAAAPETAAGEGTRIDKWLWSVRVFKTRALATAACRAGSVTIDAREAKAARLVVPGQTIVVREGLFERTFRVEGFTAARVGAKIVERFRTDLTPPRELGALPSGAIPQVLARARDQDRGRPTKKARRDFLKYFS